ncbi:MAG: TatD family hydrolase [Treponema sp.]|nr:TatD family hydrolase [Treponema sp.]
MFSDTHFHFCKTCDAGSLAATDLLTRMASTGVEFAQDIGTECDDLPRRQQAVYEAISHMAPADKSVAEKFMYFSAGIWPDPDAIRNRVEQVAVLEKHIHARRYSDTALFRKISALGECGIDHHWNPSGVDGRSESDFDTTLFYQEKELFCMQLDLARKLQLPVIVHSRDAFTDTFDCIREVGYDCGVIHCYSYGLEEAVRFLQRGWYISLSGSVTYTKKSKMEAMKELILSIPEDRLLLETDAPYLAPVPMRGTPNTPLNIRHTYEFVAQVRGITIEELSKIVVENSKKLFVTEL